MLKKIIEESQLNQEKYMKAGKIYSFLISRYLREVSSLIESNTYNAVCDVGCGEGIPLRYLLPSLGTSKIYGIDVSDEKIRLVKRNLPQGEFRLGSAYNTSYPKKSFDLVICLEVLEHLKRPEDALREVVRIATNRVILGVPHEPFWSIANMLRFKYISRLGNTPCHCQKWTFRQFKIFVSPFINIDKALTVFPWILLSGTVR